MPKKRARKSAAKKSAAKKSSTPFAAVAPGESAPGAVATSTSDASGARKGPERRFVADGKRPHDPITYGDAIALGLLEPNVLGADKDG